MIQSIVVVVVVSVPDRESLDDERVKFSARPAPLFLGVTLDETFIYVFADEAYFLRLKI